MKPGYAICAVLATALTPITAAEAAAPTFEPHLVYVASVLAPSLKAQCEPVLPGFSSSVDAQFNSWKARHASEIDAGAREALAALPGLSRVDLDAKVLRDNLAVLVKMNQIERSTLCRNIQSIATMPADAEQVVATARTDKAPPPSEEPTDAERRKAVTLYKTDETAVAIGKACAALRGNSPEMWSQLRSNWSWRYSSWIDLGEEELDEEEGEEQMQAWANFRRSSESAQKKQCSDLYSELQK